MQGLFSALGRGFNRWIGWKRLGMAASLLVISFAISTLVRMLKSIDASVILTVLEDIPPRHIALAALWVVCAFCTLTFHDFLALRTIGAKHAPYRIAALSSFASYSIGHNIGRHRLHRRRDPFPDLFGLAEVILVSDALNEIVWLPWLS